MIYSLKFLAWYTAFWLIFFFVARVIFVAYNFDVFKSLHLIDWIEVLSVGFLFDFKLTASILIFISVVLIISGLFKSEISEKGIQRISYPLSLIFLVIIVIDIELYRNWGFRMDITPLFFISYPWEAAASTTFWTYLGLFALLLFFLQATFLLFRKFILPKKPIPSKPNAVFIGSLIFFTLILFIPINSGFKKDKTAILKNDIGKNILINHVQKNEVWTFGKSCIGKLGDFELVRFLPEKDAIKVFDELNVTGSFEAKSVLYSNRPNVIIIILESFTSNLIEVLDGEPRVTPCFNELSKEGILFNKIYAAGTRSEKGLAAILAGYPAQNGKGIMMYPEKSKKLPGLAEVFNKAGYSSSFYYGGDIDFAGMRSFLKSSGFKDCISEDDFKLKESKNRWGVCDQVLFDKLFSDIGRAENPFFKVAFTLSSHEPFDVPYNSQFNGKNDTDKFRNSIKYTDSCLGHFINEAKKEEWWKNTLIVLVSDHGHRLPGKLIYSEEKSFRIPMLWLGGTLMYQDTIVNRIGSQTDLSATLLNQLNLNSDSFTFSKDLLAASKEYAMYNFADGFGFITPDACVVRNNSENKYFIEEGNFLEAQRLGEAYFQISQSDFIER